MRAYELMVILSGKLDENNAHGWLKSITTNVTAVGGKVHGNPDWWGKRRLAIPSRSKMTATTPSSTSSLLLAHSMKSSVASASLTTYCVTNCSVFPIPKLRVAAWCRQPERLHRYIARRTRN